MPESRAAAKRRAKRVGISLSNVVKSKKKGYFIAPAGVTSSGAKKAYAECRARGGAKEKCARIAHSINQKKK